MKVHSTILAFFLTAAGLLGQPIPDRYIAVFQGRPANPQASAQAAANQHGVALSWVYNNAIQGFAFAGSAQAAAALARRPDIAYVEQDQVMTAWQQVVPTGIDRADAEGAALSTDSTLVAQMGAVDVAIIDTGLSRHPDLNVVDGGVRFYTKGVWLYQDNYWEDENGHGTHVGGTVGAVNNRIGVVGIAPGARLTAVRVLDRNGSGSTSGVIAGVDWVAQNAATFEVANMSLGGGYSQALNDAVENAIAKGVLFAVAAGNSSADAKNYSPASAPTAVTVSALADSDGKPGGVGPATSYGPDDHLASFSNYGSVIDLAAPGVDILSTYIGGGYAKASGTSMAAPHVAGAAALFIAKNGLATKDKAGVEAVITALKNAAWKTGNAEYIKGGDRDSSAEPLLNVGMGENGASPGGSGANTAPVATISAPSNSATFSYGASIEFRGSATDAEDGDVSNSLVWTSTLSGVTSVIGNGGAFSADLADGEHTITATATDTQGVTGSASITIYIGSSPAAFMTVAQIHYTTDGGSDGKKHLNTHVTVQDNLGNPVGGATVTITISNTIQSWNGSGTTASNGVVSFTVKNAPSGCYTATVTALSGALPWDGSQPSPPTTLCK